MLPISLFILFVFGVKVRPGCSDLLAIPQIIVDPEQINKGDDVKLRCEAERGIRCHFYTNQSSDPFRSVNYKSGVCQFSMSGKELMEKSAHQDKAEVFLSCSIERMKQDQVVESPRSGMKKLEVNDKFGNLHVRAESEHIHKDKLAKFRCEADRASRCFFYIESNPRPFISEVYRKKYKVCVLNMSGRDLLRHRGTGNSNEFSLSCSVELETEGQNIISQKSNSIKIKVEDVEGIEELTNPYPTQSVRDSYITSAEPRQPDNHLIWIVSGGLLFLVAAIVLTFCFFKHKRNKGDSRRASEQHGNNSNCAVYETINKEHQTSMLGEEESFVFYATVKHDKYPHKLAQKAELTDKCVYSTVVRH
ncbi:uncharacterized protein [Lepisosteus oculatus]|uniref:uncharacterized protein isoform X2 n=1 Tax=Lepisosteus oculatus TaxID=7918 RepID=UPI0035F51538